MFDVEPAFAIVRLHVVETGEMVWITEFKYQSEFAGLLTIFAEMFNTRAECSQFIYELIKESESNVFQHQ